MRWNAIRRGLIALVLLIALAIALMWQFAFPSAEMPADTEMHNVPAAN